MKTKSLFCTSAIALLSLTSAAWADQSLVTDQSEIKFTFKQLGVPVTGHFKTFAGDVKLDTKALDASHVKLQVDTGSATIGDPQTDAELGKATWFNTSQFPQAVFESSAIKSVGDGKYEAVGKLTIKGASSDVTVPVVLEKAGDHTVATGTLPIQRLDYKIGDGEWSDTSMVANDVQVSFKLTVAGVE